MGEAPGDALNRRQVVKFSILGMGSFAIAAAGGGKYLVQRASAQDGTPTASDAECYTPFEGATNVKYEKLAEPPYSLALSNSYIGNVWRTQMINMANTYVTRPEVAPLISDWQVASSGEDVAQQIAQMENFITAGAQAIIVNAIDPDALVPAVQSAREQGIVVVAFDNIVNSPEIVFVNEDQVLMGQMWAEFVVEKMGETGKVMFVTGVAGTSVDTDRNNGGKAVFEQYPGIEVVEVVGKWDPGVAQTAAANALSAATDFTGIWCQGGTDGVVRAFQAAGLPVPPTGGEAENGFRKQMLAGDVDGLSIGQSPALVAVAIKVALDLLQGNELPSAISVPLPAARNEELVPGENVFPDAPDNFFTPVNIEACGITFTYEEIAPES